METPTEEPTTWKLSEAMNIRPIAHSESASELICSHRSHTIEKTGETFYVGGKHWPLLKWTFPDGMVAIEKVSEDGSYLTLVQVLPEKTI